MEIIFTISLSEQVKPSRSVLTHEEFYSGIVQIFNVKWIFISLNVRSIQSSQMLMSEGATYQIKESTEKNKQKISASVSVPF